MVAALGGSFIAYLVGAVLLVYRYNSINGDALSRVENGSAMVFSRDPHMAAVGFVWNPLPSFLATPFLFLKPWFPSLLSKGFAGNIVAAACGAVAAAVLLSLLREWKVSALLRWILLGTFALHPLVLYAGSNGMSEAPYLLFLLLSCRYLAKWMRTEATADLVYCGLSLAVGYFTRYEVAIAGAGVAVVVALVRFTRTHGRWRVRLRESIVDTVIVSAPLGFAVVAWAAASWIIVGSPFEQFTSVYGNASQLAVLGSSLGAPQSGVPALHYVGQQLNLIEPGLAVVAMIALLLAVRRRSPMVLAPVAVFGSVLVFEIYAYYQGQTASWLRYYIVAVPLVVLLAATLTSRPARDVGGRAARPIVLSLCATLVAVVGALSATRMIHDHRLAREEAAQLEAVIDSRHATPRARLALQRLGTEREVVRYLGSLHAKHGSVLIDLAQGYGIVTQSNDPKMFIITSDRDFQPSLEDPVTFHVSYIIVPPPGREGSLDAINRAYPSLYSDGAGIATLVKEFHNISDFPNWRLYKVRVEPS